jgi:hypothetical protein
MTSLTIEPNILEKTLIICTNTFFFHHILGIFEEVNRQRLKPLRRK